jgi:NAD(P)-dependent dehydrogenase (short-subunit alcohol dehydrogenase family)
MSEQPVAIVTGAYRGLGLETARRLAALGYLVLLTARRESQGQSAARALAAQGLPVRFHRLDVTDESSIQALMETVRGLGRLDVLVNNAGIAPDLGSDSPDTSVFRASLDAVRQAMETNALGPLRLCQVLIPLMKGRGRVVNVSSGMGQLDDMNGCCPGYRLSKVSLNALTRIFADELQGTGVKVNSVCPGWVRTDMGGEHAPLSVEQGAEGIVWAATLPPDGPTGGFFRDNRPIRW